MKAIEMHGYGDVDQLRYDDVPMPKPVQTRFSSRWAQQASIRSTGKPGAAI
jgi:hypothetical protein